MNIFYCYYYVGYVPLTGDLLNVDAIFVTPDVALFRLLCAADDDVDQSLPLLFTAEDVRDNRLDVDGANGGGGKYGSLTAATFAVVLGGVGKGRDSVVVFLFD